MNKSPIEIAVGQTNILIEDEVCKVVGKVGIHINKKELLKALKAYEFVEELTNYIFEYPDDDYMTMECLCRKLVKHGLLDKADGYYQTHDKTEPTISKMEQVDEPQTEPLPKTINGVRIADAVAWADKWLEDNSVSEMWDMIRTLRDATEWQDEPQTERSE